jgi:hypothetical protein
MKETIEDELQPHQIRLNKLKNELNILTNELNLINSSRNDHTIDLQSLAMKNSVLLEEVSDKEQILVIIFSAF